MVGAIVTAAPVQCTKTTTNAFCLFIKICAFCWCFHIEFYRVHVCVCAGFTTGYSFCLLIISICIKIVKRTQLHPNVWGR